MTTLLLCSPFKPSKSLAPPPSQLMIWLLVPLRKQTHQPEEDVHRLTFKDHIPASPVLSRCVPPALSGDPSGPHRRPCPLAFPEDPGLQSCLTSFFIRFPLPTKFFPSAHKHVITYPILRIQNNEDTIQPPSLASSPIPCLPHQRKGPSKDRLNNHPIPNRGDTALSGQKPILVG